MEAVWPSESPCGGEPPSFRNNYIGINLYCVKTLKLWVLFFITAIITITKVAFIFQNQLGRLGNDHSK